MGKTRAQGVLFKDYCEKKDCSFLEFTKHRPVPLLERGLSENGTPFNYAPAHAIVGFVRRRLPDP
jgi:hypothetical protein